MIKEKWICGWREDNWDGCDEFDTKEEAIEWGRSEYESYNVDGFFIGVKKPYIISSDIIDAYTVLERVSDSICDHMGECAEDYLGDIEGTQIEELEKELNAVFHKWVKKHKLAPTFYEVIKVEEIELSE